MSVNNEIAISVVVKTMSGNYGLGIVKRHLTVLRISRALNLGLWLVWKSHNGLERKK
jgi:hypothetical protein